MTLGTLEWGERHGGRLGLMETFAQVREGALARLRARLMPGLGHAEGRELARLALPDTPLVSFAAEVCRTRSEPWLVAHEGAAFDVAATRWRDVSEEARAQVLAVHPRDGMKQRLIPLLREQARRSPRTRIGLLCRMGFLGMVARAPFEA